MFRLRAEMLLAEGGAQAAAEAEEALRHALDVAHHQGAKLLELRAAVTMARWRTVSGSPAQATEALRILEQVTRQFPEVADTVDLAEARQLLQPPT